MDSDYFLQSVIIKNFYQYAERKPHHSKNGIKQIYKMQYNLDRTERYYIT